MNYSNSYIPKYTPPEERSFLTYLDDKKYEQFMENPNKSFKKTKIVNFDIIHPECRGDALDKPLEYYQTVFENNFKKHLKEDKKVIVGSALRTQKELQQNIFFEKKLVKNHFSNYDK